MTAAPPRFDPAFDGPVCVALSGGVDSMSLLHALSGSDAMRARGLRALHVHHGLHPDADAWAEHCGQACTALGVPLVVARVTVDTRRGTGVEAAARHARHAAFAAHLHAGEAIALAHHLDDQAETFLLRALRGSGVDGLAAMRALRRFEAGWMWRPWLHAARAEIEAYAARHALRFVGDPSNDDVRLDRNFLRHRVLPLLRERWPHVAASFARSARHAADAACVLDAQAMAGLHDGAAADEPAGCDAAAVAVMAASMPARDAVARQTRIDLTAPSLDIARLRTLDPRLRARVLRRWAVVHRAPPLPAVGIARIESDLLAARADAAAEFRWAGHRIRAWNGQLHLLDDAPPLPLDWTSAWDGKSPLALPDGAQLSLDPPRDFPTVVTVRARRGGERIRLPGRAHSHALKHVLQDLGIPPWRRARMPLLVGAGGEVLAAGDAVIGEPLAQWLRETGTRLAWKQPSASRDR